MNAADAKTIIDYNEKGLLTRTFLSPSWGAGWFAGTMSAIFNQSCGKETCGKEKLNSDYALGSESHYVVSMLQNNSLFLMNGLVAIFKMAGSAKAVAVSAVTSPLLIVLIAADGLGVGTKKSFGAFRVGYTQGKSCAVPVKSP